MATNHRAFIRAKMMMSAILSITNNSALDIVEQQAALDGMKPYKSRGHGRGVVSGSRTKVAAKMRRQKNISISVPDSATGRKRTYWVAGNKLMTRNMH